MAPGCSDYSIGFGWFVVALGAALAAFGAAAWLWPDARLFRALRGAVDRGYPPEEQASGIAHATGWSRERARRRQAVFVRFVAPAVGALWIFWGLVLVAEGVQCNRDYAAIHGTPPPASAPR